MKIYSDYPVRRTFQIVMDVAAIALIAIGVWLGVVVSEAIAELADVGRKIEAAGSGFEGAMTDAGEALGNVPFVGSTIRGPFDTASGTGGALAEAGRTTESFIETTAMIVGVVLAGVIVITVSWLWLRRRYRFTRRATEATRLTTMNGGIDVLALRALTTGSCKDLAKTGLHPFDGWRSGDRVVISRLADVELRGAGVRIAR